MAVERLAPAKVNLFLHVGPVGGDGYHPICSLMAFADVGDVVRIEPATRMGFAVEGPYGETLARQRDNLVVRARDEILAISHKDFAPFRLTLDKRLPIAAGLGGGSADAAATLLLVGERLGLLSDAADERSIWGIARRLGSDVPACLNERAVMATGRGDDLHLAPAFPDLHIVLVNPGALSPTAAVYGAYDEAGAPGAADLPDLPEAFTSAEALAVSLAICRNDLEAPAVALEPKIGEALACIRREPETLLGRMSGSGATCFALCGDRSQASALASRIGDAHPQWWVRTARLTGFRP